MTKWYLLCLTIPVLWLSACTARTRPHTTAKYNVVHLSENLETKDKVSVVVNRGPESWQFLAFMFAAIWTLGVYGGGALFNRLAQVPFLSSYTKRTFLKVLLAQLVWFLLCFYLVMVNAWIGNELLKLLTWLKRQPL